MNKPKIDKTKRRAVLAFCMDTLVRAFGDEDLLPAWLEEGVPDGCYDSVPESAFDSIAEAYDDAVIENDDAVIENDEADKYWSSLESLFIFTVLRGVWGDAEFIQELVVPEEMLFT